MSYKLLKPNTAMRLMFVTEQTLYMKINTFLGYLCKLLLNTVRLDHSLPLRRLNIATFLTLKESSLSQFIIFKLCLGFHFGDKILTVNACLLFSFHFCSCLFFSRKWHVPFQFLLRYVTDMGVKHMILKFILHLSSLCSHAPSINVLFVIDVIQLM